MSSTRSQTTEAGSAENDGQGEGRFRLWPDLSYRYGFSFDQIRFMPNAVRKVYEDALPRLKAEDMAAAIDAAAFVHMRGDAQRRLLRRLNRDLKRGLPPVRHRGAKFQQAMAASGIGVKLVPVKGDRDA